jgi:hypothetical protein
VDYGVKESETALLTANPGRMRTSADRALDVVGTGDLS